MSVSNEEIYKILLSIKEDVGGLKNGLSANEDHTSHVSRKIDTVRAELKAEDANLSLRFDAHINTVGAHGVAAEERGRAGVFAAIGIVGALCGALAGALVVFRYMLKAVQ